MEQKVNTILIKPALNGWLVYLNQDFSQGTIQPVPYVFETMENLLEFIKTQNYYNNLK